MYFPPNQVDTAFQLAERAVTEETSTEMIHAKPKKLTTFQDMVSSDLGSLGVNSEHFQRGGRACLTRWSLQKTLDQNQRANYLRSIKPDVSCYCTNAATTSAYFRYSYWVMSGKAWLPWRSLPDSSGRTHKMYFTKIFHSFVCSQFLCAWAKHKNTKQKNHHISSHFEYFPSIARI